MHINLTILSTKDTTLFSNGHNSVYGVVHICFANSEKIIEIIKSYISAIWDNIQVIKKSDILRHSFTTMVTIQLYKSFLNKLNKYLDIFTIKIILSKNSTVTLYCNTYVFKHIVTDNQNIAIVEEQKKSTL